MSTLVVNAHTMTLASISAPPIDHNCHMLANTLVHYNTSTGFKLWNLYGEVKLVRGPGNQTIPFHSTDSAYVYEGDGTLEIEAVDCTMYMEAELTFTRACILAVLFISVSILAVVYFVQIAPKCADYYSRCCLRLRRNVNAGFVQLPHQGTPHV